MWVVGTTLARCDMYLVKMCKFVIVIGELEAGRPYFTHNAVETRPCPIKQAYIVTNFDDFYKS